MEWKLLDLVRIVTLLKHTENLESKSAVKCSYEFRD